MIKKVLAIFVMTFSLASVTASAWHNGGVSNAKINAITTLQNGSFYIEFDRDICDSGVNKVGYVYVGKSAGGVSQSSQGRDMLLSTAISAFVSGKRVKVYADNSGSDWGCHLGALKIQP